MGIRTHVSHNYAMTLGGLKQGVTPLDMAHAYETFASGGDLIYGTLSPGADNARGETAPGPVGIERITHEDDGKEADRAPERRRRRQPQRERNVLDHAVAEQVGSLLQGVVRVGTGTRAQVADTVVAGKTGTTEGYGDAWFVGWTPKYTVAVWVGYPDEFKSMETEFAGPAGRRRHVPGRDLPVVHRGRPARTTRRRTPRSPPRRRPRRRRTATDGPGADGGAAADDTGGARRAPSRPGAGADRAGPGADHSDRLPTPAPGGDAGAGRRRHRLRRRARPGGHGRDTLRDPAAQNRHGSSTALVIPIRVPDDRLDVLPARRRRLDRDRPRGEVGRVVLERDAERLGELARPGAQVVGRSSPRRGAHVVEPLERLERADQHRRADAPGPRRPRSAARGCRRSGTRTRGPAARTACCVRAVRPTYAWQAGSEWW